MYAQQSLQDTLFLMLYGAVAILALVSGLYLWLRRSNGFLPDVTPPRALRRWTAAFFIMAALSHVWWYVLGIYWLTDDRLVRNITAVTLDHILLVPMVMAILLRILQDRQRRLWPWGLAQVPILVFAAIGITTHSAFYGFDMTTYWQMAVMSIFILYYIYALIQYGRWLRENYADLEHKEVWQSLLFAVVLFVIYEVYFTNPGEMAREFLSQLETLAIIAFLLWRVETLETLDAKETVLPEDISDDTQTGESSTNSLSVSILNKIQDLLDIHCEAGQLYLQHDLTLQQLAMAISTNRTYLSTYFAQKGITYNAYINRLRVDHFMRLYCESVNSDRPIAATQLALKSGFRSYSTFSNAFKNFRGLTVAAWMANIQAKKELT